MVEHSHRAVLGWANHFCLDQVIPASATKRLSKWLCRKQNVRMGEIPALPGRAPTARHGSHASGGADVISNNSPVREKRTLGSMSGERKRGQGGD